MTSATLKVSKRTDILGSLKLIINNHIDTITLIHIEDSGHALELYRQLSIGWYDHTMGTHPLIINDTYTVSLDYDEWVASLSCLDQWFQEFLQSETSNSIAC